jgi:hypothetical protein
LQRAGAALDRVSLNDQIQILTWMLQRRGVSVEALSLVEGAVAMRAEHAEGAGQDAAAAAGSPGQAHTLGENIDGAVASVQSTALGAPPPVNPGPWSPPGDQPIPFYIGNEAHNAIGREYEAAHPTDVVFLNNTPMATIIRSLARLASCERSRLPSSS